MSLHHAAHNRNGAIRFLTNTTDLTTAAKPYTFWLNDDRDSGSDNQAEDLDPAGGGLDGADAFIVNERDLEDFTRLHLRVDAVSGAQLAAGTLSVTLEWRSVSNTPSLRLFRAVEADGGTNYLVNTAISGQQIISPWNAAVGAVASGAALTLPASYWSGASGSNFLRYFLYEGVAAGSGQLVAVLKQGGTPVAESAPVHLRLRKVTDFLEHFTMGDTIDKPWNQITAFASPASDSGVYESNATESGDYILFVHGWRMQPWERRAFAHTAFKRLYWQGYKGRFGLFSWPTDWIPLPGGLVVEPENFNRSERIAWVSARGLQRRLIQLNALYPGKVRVFAHSMGNVLVSENLLRQTQAGHGGLINTFVASQAATAAHAYDPVNPAPNRYALSFQTPNIYGAYPPNPPSAKHYFVGTGAGTGRTFNYHNEADFALAIWELNQDIKPNFPYRYIPQAGQFYYVLPGLSLRKDVRSEVYELFAHAAEARSRSLGAAVTGGFTVQGGINVAINLNTGPFSYGDNSYEHSAQFRSTNMRRRSYYNSLLNDFQIPR